MLKTAGSVKWDRKAKRYYFKHHRCWWRTAKRDVLSKQEQVRENHNKMLDSAEEEYLLGKRETER